MIQSPVAERAALSENEGYPPNMEGVSVVALSKSEVEARLAGMDGWKRDDGEIEKKFQFAGFKQAMAFVNRVADAAEAADHHPDIKISYNKVKISLSTHSEGGVTEKDFALAAQIDAAKAASN
jgi:4a-hydroxytetrahydrobiopterin dehydratase